jgi:hypothetical protein
MKVETDSRTPEERRSEGSKREIGLSGTAKAA